MLSVTPRLVLAELQKRGVECRVVESKSPRVFIEYVDKLGRHHFINGTVTGKSSAVACRIADDKLLTAVLAERVGVPVPETMIYSSPEEASAFLQRHGRLVVKPLDSAHGHGVTVGIDSVDALLPAAEHAGQFSKTVLLQQMVSGRDLRLLFIGGEFVAATHRKPASVTGDGQHSVRELIELVNQDPERGEGYEKKYTFIPLPIAEAFLGSRYSDVPAVGEEVQVIGTANVGSGGTANDMTDDIAPALVEYGKKLVGEVGVGVCGIDFIEDENGAFLIEINASPSFGLHTFPHQGTPRDVTVKFVDWLLADDTD